MTNISKIEIFTDGATSKVSATENIFTGAFAYAIVFKREDNTIFSKIINSAGHKDTTINQMELSPVIEALNEITEIGLFKPIRIVSDSEYFVKGMNEYLANWKKNGWKLYNKKPVKNMALWKEVDQLVESLRTKTEVKIEHIRAHSRTLETFEQKMNDIVDKLAVRHKELLIEGKSIVDNKYIEIQMLMDTNPEFYK